MSKKTPYCRPGAKVSVVYPKNIREQLKEGDLNLLFTDDDASKLAIALINAVTKVQARNEMVIVRVRLKDNQVSVVLSKKRTSPES